MPALPQVYRHPNRTSEVCSVLHSFVMSESDGCPFRFIQMPWVFPPSFLSLVTKQRAIPCTLISLKNRPMGSYPSTQQASWWAQRVPPVKQQKDTCRLFTYLFFTGKNLMDRNELRIQVFIRIWSATVPRLCIFL